MNKLPFFDDKNDPKRNWSIPHEVEAGIYTLWSYRLNPFWPSVLDREAIQTLRDLGGHKSAALTARLWLLIISRIETAHREIGKYVFLRLPERDQIIRELFPVRCKGWKVDRYRKELQQALKAMGEIITCGHRIITSHKDTKKYTLVRTDFPKGSQVGPKLDIDKLMELGQKSKVAFFLALEASRWFGRLNVRMQKKSGRWFQVPTTKKYRDRYQISKRELMEWSGKDWRDTKKALKLIEEIGFAQYDGETLIPSEKWAGWVFNSMDNKPNYIKVPRK